MILVKDNSGSNTAMQVIIPAEKKLDSSEAKTLDSSDDAFKSHFELKKDD